MPRVSVILTSFNHGKYICEAIESTLNQTFTDFELIILDDHSLDNSWDLINQYSDPRIKAFRNEVNKGPVEGVNKTISEVVTGEYIAIHHSDDVWELDKLGKQVAFLDANPEIGAVFTNALAITEDGTPLTDKAHCYFNIFEQPNRTRHEWLRFFFTRGNALCHPSALIRKTCYEDCGLYRFGFAQVADFDMWIRLCLKYEICVLPEKLVRFRVRDNEANASGNRPEARIRGLYEFYKLLPNYQKIKKLDDLAKVFPIAEKYYRDEETDMDFALAMVALEEKPYAFTPLFGLDLLFEAISDPKRSANIKHLYDFDYRSFIDLTAKYDVFSREEVSQLWGSVAERDGQLTNLTQAIAEREHHIRALIGSRSWRLTGPLRKIGALARRFSTYLHRLTKLLAWMVDVIKYIPAAITHWGIVGLSKRVIRVLRESGARGLLRRKESFQSLLVQKATHPQFYKARRRQVQASLPPVSSRNRTAPKIAYVVNAHDLMTQVYRVYNYSDALAAHGYTCVILRDDDIGPDTDLDADLLVLNRIPWSENTDTLIRRFRETGRPTIFDIDDFIFDPNQMQSLRPCQDVSGHNRENILSMMQRIKKTMQACDLTTVSTFALKLEVEKCGLPAFVLPNNNGLSQIELARKIEHAKAENKSIDGPVCIGYFSGTKTHEEDFAECAEALQRVLKENPDAELVIVGHLDLPPALAGMESRIRRRPLMAHPDMLTELSTIDVSLAPLELSNRFTNCKSELKIFEPALFGIPTVASPISTFSAVIENGKTGYLATTPDEWYAALTALVRNRDLRHRIGEAARNQIASRYAITTTVEEAKAIYDAAYSGRLRRRPDNLFSPIVGTARPLITIVSVLYRKAREVRCFLEALRRQDFPGRYEIILVDDQTPDDSVAVVQDFQRWATYAPYGDSRMDIRILRNAANIGNCGSRNAAIREARGDVIIVVDADCMFNLSFLSSHFAAQTKGDCDIAIGPINIETHGVPPLSALGCHEATQMMAEAENLLQDPINLDSFVNCITRNFSIRRSFLENNLGGTLFDESFTYSADPKSGFGWEDVEMGYRAYAAGGRIKYLSNTVSIHVTHDSSASEAEKPIRSLRNFRRLFEKHPEILTASRQWSFRTYEAIVSWVRSVGANPDGNPDYQWLELRFRRYWHAPIIIDRSRKLRILTYRWHVPHQFELYRTGHHFTLLTGTGTALCDSWEFVKRPMPGNARMIPADQVDTRDFDLAILHFDENVLYPELCNGKVPDDWGQTLRWFLDNVDLPKVAICHGTPQFVGQYNGNYAGPDLGQVLEAERKAVVDLLGDIRVVCNSHQAQSEWGFRNGLTIWHGFSPHEYPAGSHERDVLLMLQAALHNRPHYNGLFVFEDVRRLVANRLHMEYLKTPEPSQGYTPASPEWAVSKYQDYVREVGRYSIYFNPTVRSPMPRVRGEAMMAGLVSVSLRNHDVDLFIKNGVNGFYADTPEELAGQLLWLADHPREREKIGHASRVTAMDIFNQDRYLAEWSQLLNTLIS